MEEKTVSCRGVNGSITLSKDTLTILGVGKGHLHKIRFSDVSSIVVERKSVVPSATAMILAIIAFVIVQYNLFWFIINLYGTTQYIAPLASIIAIISGLLTVLRFGFVNVSLRSRSSPLTLRLVSIRSAKRLAREFSEMSARR